MMQNNFRYKSPCFQQGLSIILAFSLMVSIVLAALFLAAEFVLFQPDTYQKALNAGNVYARLPELVAEQILSGSSQTSCENDPALCDPDGNTADAEMLGGMPDYMRNIGKEDWETILQILLPQDWLRIQADSMIDQVFAGLNANVPVKPVLSMAGLKQNLTRENLQVVVQTVMRSSPPCTNDDILAMASIALGLSDAAVPVCMPPEEFKPIIEETLLAYLVTLAQELPAEVPIDLGLGPGAEPEAGQTGNSSSFSGSRIPFKTIRFAFIASPLLSLILLALLTLAAVRSWSALGGWWGAPLLAAGLLLLLLAASGLAVFDWVTSNLLVPAMPEMVSAGIEQIVTAVIRDVAGQYTLRISIGAGIIAFFGAGLLLFSWFTRRRY